MSQNVNVKITDQVRYCPDGADAETLMPGDVVSMAPVDAYNIASGGRGVVVSDTAREKRVARDVQPAAAAA